MRKVLIVFVLGLLASSCVDDVVFNNPSIQGLKNGVFWRSLQNGATLLQDGSIVIEASTLKEKLSLHLSSTEVKTFVLDNNRADYASFYSRENTPEITYYTANGKGTGKISVTEYDTTNRTISGTFKFIIPISTGDATTQKEFYFSQGVFYKVPVVLEAPISTK
ncbi:DUF6252 family protein [Flavobacterium sp. RSSA_27]|uniref:DUF6252 family protein n=1 Tax=Flavobacterium sp. RSSA_27 TaxID=3447667 RepID=UPI003F3C40FA